MQIDVDKFIAALREEASVDRDVAQNTSYPEHDRMASAIIAGVCNRIAFALEQAKPAEPEQLHPGLHHMLPIDEIRGDA